MANIEQSQLGVELQHEKALPGFKSPEMIVTTESNVARRAKEFAHHLGRFYGDHLSFRETAVQLRTHLSWFCSSASDAMTIVSMGMYRPRAPVIAADRGIESSNVVDTMYEGRDIQTACLESLGLPPLPTQDLGLDFAYRPNCSRQERRATTIKVLKLDRLMKGPNFTYKAKEYTIVRCDTHRDADVINQGWIPAMRHRRNLATEVVETPHLLVAKLGDSGWVTDLHVNFEETSGFYSFAPGRRPAEWFMHGHPIERQLLKEGAIIGS